MMLFNVNMHADFWTSRDCLPGTTFSLISVLRPNMPSIADKAGDCLHPKTHGCEEMGGWIVIPLGQAASHTQVPDTEERLPSLLYWEQGDPSRTGCIWKLLWSPSASQTQVYHSVLLVSRVDRQYQDSEEAALRERIQGSSVLLGLGWVVAGLAHGWQQQTRRWSEIFAELNPSACWDFAGMTSKVLGVFPTCESCSQDTPSLPLPMHRRVLHWENVTLVTPIS